MSRRILTILFCFTLVSVFAGNPDRQGESGAGELLLNPWARSAGLHSMNSSSISGVEAMRVNVAGIGRLSSSKEMIVANTRLYEGSTLQLNAFGYAQKTKSGNGAFCVTLTTVNFGDIQVTTEDLPEGTGGTFSPSFFNMGVGYAYTYENKISVGILFRGVSESLTALNAFGLAVDAGVQYVSGDNDEFKLGISLRNVGTPMAFGGDALGTRRSNGEIGDDYLIRVDNTAKSFELPSLLNIGMSYDLFFRKVDDGNGAIVADRSMFVTVLGNFTSNAFSSDLIGGGAEFNYKNMFMLRGGYRYSLGKANSDREDIYTGLSGGASFVFRLGKATKSKMGLDYAYRTTAKFAGTHNFSVRFLF
jgi:hypothetical protein